MTPKNEKALTQSAPEFRNRIAEDIEQVVREENENKGRRTGVQRGMGALAGAAS